MTYLLPANVCSIDVEVDDHGQPTVVMWQGKTHAVEAVTNTYRIDEGWWDEHTCRDYFALTSRTGWYMVVFHDVLSDVWILERLYD